MTMITPSYLGETIEYSSLHACRSTLEDPTLNQHKCDHIRAFRGVASGFRLGTARLSLVVQSVGCIRTDKNTLPLPAALRTARSATNAILRTAFG